MEIKIIKVFEKTYKLAPKPSIKFEDVTCIWISIYGTFLDSEYDKKMKRSPKELHSLLNFHFYLIFHGLMMHLLLHINILVFSAYSSVLQIFLIAKHSESYTSLIPFCQWAPLTTVWFIIFCKHLLSTFFNESDMSHLPFSDNRSSHDGYLKHNKACPCFSFLRYQCFNYSKWHLFNIACHATFHV